MADIALIGLGKMGAALGWALHGAGHDLTVWNRSAARMQPFAEKGVTCASSPGDALAAAPVVLISIDGYTSTRALIEACGGIPQLQGQVIVQLSTGTPKEAAIAAEWAGAGGVAYLDGAIIAGPTDIGTAEATILLSGGAAAYQSARRFLHCLSPDLRYLGEAPGAAAALDLAWLTLRYGTFVSFAHAANLCASEGVGVEALMALEPDRPDIQTYGGVVRDEGYAHSTATLDVWAEALERVRQHAREAGINGEVPDFIGGLFERARARGHGPENVMSLVRVLAGG